MKMLVNKDTTLNDNPININTQSSVINSKVRGVIGNNDSNVVGSNDKSITFAATVHTTLPVRTASQGVSFALYTLLSLQFSPIKSLTYVF